MSNQSQCHFSGERLQFQWSSGFALERLSKGVQTHFERSYYAFWGIITLFQRRTNAF